jgi:septal ring factor EnvC (AmiA/AmiB activator)
MKTVWLYIKVILTAIAGVFLLFFLKGKSGETIKTIKKDIDKNHKEIDKLKVKEEKLSKKKQAIKNKIDKSKMNVIDLKNKKDNIDIDNKTLKDSVKHLKSIGNEKK